MLFKDKEFETALNQAATDIRNTEPDRGAAEAAAARVWKNIAREVLETAPADLGGEIAGCADVQALLPAYRAGKLTQAREWLVQDHLRECVNCRNAAGARKGVVLPWRQDETTRRISMTPARRLAWAAGIVLTVGLTAWSLRDSFLPAPDGERARLEAAEGPVYLLASTGQRQLRAGEPINERDWVRTPTGTRAFIRLRDGSRVELGERAEVSIAMNRKDTTLYLERGMVIVEAAKRRSGHLSVAAGETTAYVTGTVFAVNRGIKGSRVSVIEGSVRVNQPARGAELRAGEQLTSTDALEPVPIRSEIAWSRNVDSHLKLLEQTSALARDIESIRLPNMRYESRILRMLPADTVVYAALPNLGDTLKQAHQMFEDHMRGSAELRSWWEKNSQHANDTPSISQLVEFVRGATEFLGDEIVIALVQRPGNDKPAVGLIAEVNKQGLREYIDTHLQKLGAGGRPHMHLTNSLVVLSPEESMLQYFMNPGSLSANPFGQRIAEAYRDGASILFCADLSRLNRHRDAPAQLAAQDLRYVVIEQRELQGKSESRATVNFAGERHGVASWLASPGPMGSLDYISPGATFAAAFVVKEPDLILNDLLGLAAGGKDKLESELNRLERQLGLRVREDIAMSLGNEVTVALDGAILPPAWKVVVEVRDPVRIQQVIDKLVAEYNRQAREHKRTELVVREQQMGGRTMHDIQLGEGGIEISYTFTDGYLVMASSGDTLRRAMRSKDGGNRVRLSRFLTADANPHFSAVVYHDLSRVGMTITDALNAAGSLTPEQRAQAEKLAAQARPGVIYAYAENDRIRIASTGGFFGLTFESLLGSAGISDLMNKGRTGAMNQFGQVPGFQRGPDRADKNRKAAPGAPAPPQPPAAPGVPR
jgi:ferric-dicitrate binding protein FerR (iron transport regulator)